VHNNTGGYAYGLHWKKALGAWTMMGHTLHALRAILRPGNRAQVQTHTSHPKRAAEAFSGAYRAHQESIMEEDDDSRRVLIVTIGVLAGMVIVAVVLLGIFTDLSVTGLIGPLIVSLISLMAILPTLAVASKAAEAADSAARNAVLARDQATQAKNNAADTLNVVQGIADNIAIIADKAKQ
jgi:hypothetical protein